MGIFSKVSYHFPSMERLGEWEWDTETKTWILHLHPGSRSLLGLSATNLFLIFNDERVTYSHLTGFSMHLEDLITATISVTGEDGREYLWNKISEHWRNKMNAGKRVESPCDLPYSVKLLRLWSESSKDFHQYYQR
jgi:hypothetical protein